MKHRFFKLCSPRGWKNIYYLLIGLASGILNGFFGSGGGMLCVPMLKQTGIDQKHAHATSISVIFPLTVFSAVLYLINGDVSLTDTWELLIPALLGAVCGSLFLKKISNIWLKRLFGGFILFAAIRMLLK